jgi:hypothetical protein
VKHQTYSNHGEKKNVHEISVGKPQRVRSFKKSIRGWDNIKMDVNDIGWEVTNWINLAKYRDRIFT